MSQQTTIEWLARPGTIPWSWNFIAGCTKVGIGCDHCYAVRMSWRVQSMKAKPDRYEGVVEKLDNGRLDWTGEVNVDREALGKPLRWKRQIKGVKRSHTCFVCSMSDFFHWKVPRWVQAQAFGVMAARPESTFIMLTKRPGQARVFFEEPGFGFEEAWSMRDMVMQCGIQGEYLFGPGYKQMDPSPQWPLPNVWGVLSVSTHRELEGWLPNFSRLPYWVKGLSIEPMMAPVNLNQKCIRISPGVNGRARDYVDWVIIGCESGAGRSLGRFGTVQEWQRYAKKLVRECQEWDLRVFVKQIPVIKKYKRDRLAWVASTDMDEWPEDLRVREWPA